MAITDFISSSKTAPLAERSRQVALHQTDADSMYMGEITEAGFTVLAATSASDFITKLQTACSSTTANYVVEMQWNGESTTSSFSVSGPATANLTYDDSVPWDYQHPSGGRVIVRPAVGYNPTFACTGNVLSFTGANKIHIKGGTWKCGFYFGSNPTYFPLAPIFAITDTEIDGEGFDEFGVQYIFGWSVHLENNQFLRNWSCVSGSSVYYRAWNNSSMYGRDNDIQGFRGFEGWMSGYMANIWSAGWRVFHTDTSVTDTGLHPDFFQIMTFDDVHEGYNIIMEFNIVHMDGRKNGYHSQGLFGNDSKNGGGTLDHTVNAVVHNNIIAIGAYWALSVSDPEDNGEKLIHRNMVLRCAYGYEADSVQYVVGFRGSDKSAGSGYMDISENYMHDKQWAVDDPLSSGTTLTGNIELNPSASAGAGEAPQDLLSGADGNGAGWSSGNYTRPETGETTVAGSTSAFLDFVEPQVGWRGANAGPVDPATWPTDYLTLQAGEPPTLPVMGRNITINLTAG